MRSCEIVVILSAAKDLTVILAAWNARTDGSERTASKVQHLQEEHEVLRCAQDDEWGDFSRKMKCLLRAIDLRGPLIKIRSRRVALSSPVQADPFRSETIPRWPKTSKLK